MCRLALGLTATVPTFLWMLVTGFVEVLPTESPLDLRTVVVGRQNQGRLQAELDPALGLGRYQR